MQRALKAPRLLSIALMVALVYGVTLFAPAAVYAGPKPTLPTQLKITKKLVGPTGSIPAEALFSFAFEKVSFNDFTDGANLDKMPDIPAQELTLGTTNQGNTSQDGGTATTTLTRQLNIALEPTNGDALPGPPTVSPRPGGPNGLINLSMKLPFSHPGIYKYRLTEPDNGANPNILMSRASYVLTLLVESQGPSYKTTSFTAEREKDDDGAAAAGKINAAADDVVLLNRVIPPQQQAHHRQGGEGRVRRSGQGLQLCAHHRQRPVNGRTRGQLHGQDRWPGIPVHARHTHHLQAVS